MDHLANLLNGLKTAGAVKKESIVVPHSKFKESVVRKLQELGYVAAFKKTESKGLPQLKIELAYKKTGSPKIVGMKRISKQSRRLYAGVKDLYRVRQGHGHLLITSPKGVVTGQEATAAQVGGELLFEIW